MLDFLVIVTRLVSEKSFHGTSEKKMSFNFLLIEGNWDFFRQNVIKLLGFFLHLAGGKQNSIHMCWELINSFKAAYENKENGKNHTQRVSAGGERNNMNDLCLKQIDKMKSNEKITWFSLPSSIPSTQTKPMNLPSVKMCRMHWIVNNTQCVGTESIFAQRNTINFHTFCVCIVVSVFGFITQQFTNWLFINSFLPFIFCYGFICRRVLFTQSHSHSAMCRNSIYNIHIFYFMDVGNTGRVLYFCVWQCHRAPRGY